MLQKLLFILLILINFQLFSQVVIIAAGETSKTTNASMHWTLGQLVTGSATNGSYTIINGFQQSTLVISNIIEPADSSYILKIYPNPSSEFVIIENTSPSQSILRCKLYDLSGILLFESDLIKKKTKIDFSKYKSGFYILNIYNSLMDVKVSSHKIIKQ